MFVLFIATTSSLLSNTAAGKADYPAGWHILRSMTPSRPPLSPYYTDDHETFRAQVRKFVDKECAPHIDKWEEAGELPKAFITLAPGAELTEQDVKDFVAGQVASYKQIRLVEFIDEVPKSASGKILRRELRG